jgi:carboxyl-terminal processing protease
MLGGEELPEVEETLRERYARVIGDLEQNGPLDVLELYLSALGTVYDPHTLYMKPASNDNFDIEMSNSVTGIGAQLRTKGPYTVVSEVIAGGPADLDARLRAGDRIIAVAQGNADAEDIVDRRLDDVVRLIRGEKGTVVRLTVIPADATDNAERVVIDIRRDRVVLEASKASVTLHDVQGANGSSKVAVIDVPSFYGPPAGQKDGTVTDDVRALLEPLAEQGVDSVVLDMRMNGGGLLSEAIRMTGLFITSGPVVQVRDPSGDIETLSDRDRGEVAYDGPLVILTSPLSASATEIVAGALRDHGRAVVVGSETTHGKGTVQTLLDPGGEVRRLTGVNVGQDLGVVKLTVQKFYLPSGSSTQLRGVPSDIVIPSPFDDGEFSEADLDNPLPWDEVAPAKYRPMADLGPVLAELRSRSSARVAASDELRKLAEEVAEVRRLQNEPSVSLNLETRRAELEERKAKFGSGEDPEMGAFNAEDDSERPDPVLDEAVLVAADLISVAG